MSIAEFPSGPGSTLDGGWTISPEGAGYAGGGGGGDRTPPQDNDAEQSVIGSMLLSKDAIADVIETVRGTDFYRPAHETIFDAIVDLYGRGEPADPVTVAAELQRRGELGRVGGAPYLHTLSASVPIAANASYYAEIVREKAVLRRLVGAGTRIAQWGYSGEGEVDELVDRAQAEVYAVTDKRTAEDYAPLSEIMEATLDEIEAISNRDGEMVGVPTGFADLDELTNGLHGGQMIIVAARPAMGKALALDTPLPSPSGWTTMGAVGVGDQLYDGQGRPTRVVAATDVMEGRPCYEVGFSDGSLVVADAEHLWAVALPGTGARVLTTAQIAAAGEQVFAIAMPGGGSVKIDGVRPVASVPVRCVQVDNPDHLYLAGESGVPTHNSTLALDFCRSASVHHNLASVIFSLEMTRNEITMRLLSAEGKIPLNHMRNGHMGDEDWAKLARKMGEVSSAPLFIDDSPNMTMMEIRAKARRLKQRHDLRLIVIDYLQLMSSGKKVESRQLEVSEFSRQIKLLAKELDVPIIALSQLNRGPEQRADKRPLMSDLRESGCVTADTRVMRADTNVEVTVGELMRSGARDVPVWALDERLKLVPRTMTHAFTSGVKDVYRVRLASGREIRATANHPFLTLDGWRPLAELAEGSRVGAIRHVPPPLAITPRDPEEVALLARRIGSGSSAHGQPVSERHDECLPDGDGVPGWVFSLPKVQVAAFLRTLWAAGGCVDRSGAGGRISYASTSRRLVDDVARLLLRFNVFTRLTHAPTDDRDLFRLDVSGTENLLRFIDDVGVRDSDATGAAILADRLRTATGLRDLDTVPEQVWDRVREILGDHRVSRPRSTTAARTSGGATTTEHTRAHQPLAEVATVLADADLQVVATNDVLWDEVASIELVGTEEVYDATVMGVHNFVANGMPIHNSIEQDADMVILLHREDAYEKESTRPGEADLIVAKHRNGPTRDVVVAFQGHYSRFVDMAHG